MGGGNFPVDWVATFLRNSWQTSVEYADLAQSRHRKEKLGVGRHPTGALLGQDAAGDQGMQVKVGFQDLIPGMEDHGGAQLTA